MFSFKISYIDNRIVSFERECEKVTITKGRLQIKYISYGKSYDYFIVDNAKYVIEIAEIKESKEKSLVFGSE